ncbi:hypothetical protein [Blastococcus sp. CCUG 61487]|uniref:hypothetical protein n=1 Tax=Blastococcus sp. CCUG 61487 TaxID=1840703 RepID=UPI0010BF7DE4|nr:hypothetical protein [Blastococcus sp. CCUG 61487]TKJ18808.1 hypothetical protein A6V29_11090 [Blastococcus sp. CCUG 61487]
MNEALFAVLAADEQLPEDIGKSGPLGLLLIGLLLIAVIILVRSMTRHLKKLPRSFEPGDDLPEVPDSPAELIDTEPGGEVLEALRRRPLAIEPPRRDDGRPGGTPA